MSRTSIRISTGLSRVAVIAALSAVAITQLSACFPLVAAGAVGGTLAASDRRTFGTQLEDRQIQLRAESTIANQLRGANVNVTSYNRKVLLTGEVANEESKALAEQLAGRIENVQSVLNELEVMGASSSTSRLNDSAVTAKVKAAFVDDKEIYANTFKVTTERGIVYLMGRVTQVEGERAAQVASKVSGVTKVIKVLDYITDEDLGKMKLQPAPNQPAADAKKE